MEESITLEDEGVYLTIPRGGPIYVPNLVGPLTRIPDFESSVFNELQSLKDLLCSESDSSQPCDDDDLDISVDELKIFTEEELVDMAMKEAFKERDDDAQNVFESSLQQCNGGGNDPGTSSNNRPCLQNSGAIVPIESSDGIPSRNGGSKVPGKQIPKKRKKATHVDDDAYIAKVEQLAEIKQKQEEEKATLKLHSFNAACKINSGAISSSERTERMKSLRSTNTAVKVKSSSLNEHLTVPYPEVLCVEVYHSRRTWLKTQEFLIFGRQYLTELRDSIYCSTNNLMQKAKQHDPFGYFLIEGDCKHTIVIRDMRLINEEDDVNNRAAYPILLFQMKSRIQKCSVCNIARAEKVTVDDKWAAENPCYFCRNCYFLLHYNLDGSLLHTDFSVFDYQHD